MSQEICRVSKSILCYHQRRGAGWGWGRVQILHYELDSTSLKELIRKFSAQSYKKWLSYEEFRECVVVGVGVGGFQVST